MNVLFLLYRVIVRRVKTLNAVPNKPFCLCSVGWFDEGRGESDAVSRYQHSLLTI